MTQERKAQLCEWMLAWICEHITNDEDLFLTLHCHCGMTAEELHEYGIGHPDCFSPDGKEED